MKHSSDHLLIPDSNESVILDIEDAQETTTFRIQKNSNLTLLITGKISKVYSKNIRIVLSEPGAGAKIFGCFSLHGKGSLDLTSVQEHAAPSTTSDLLVKSVLADSASFRFNGIINISKYAQKSDAYQRNENLLISPQVECKTNPVLEILANDVRCTHGATSGPISDEEIWYIMSRGINEREAKQLIIRGFLYSVFTKVQTSDSGAVFEKKIWELM